MSEPIIFVVDPDAEALAGVETALQRRFGADYRIETDTNPSSAVGRLEQACARGESIALVIAAVSTTDTTALDWLARVHELCPWASRCALLSWGDPQAYPVVRQAIALGRFDTWLVKPLGDPEERLYPLVAEILGLWVRTTRPSIPVVTIVGEQWARRSHELRDLFERASLPYAFCAHDGDEGRRRLGEIGHAGRLPAVIFGGQCLADPTNAEIARLLGVNAHQVSGVYDLVVIGAGPAGLSTAVYAASDGLRTLVIERFVTGGQAGTSSMIRNYLGFPRGISGADLAHRAHEQAFALGAEFLLASHVISLSSKESEHVLTLEDGTQVTTRAVVVATGVSYNRLAVDGIDRLIGKGVFYGTATAEAPAHMGRDVFVVGGANSAGQAIVHLARYASTVTVLVRGDGLTMSDYLVKQLERAGNVRIRLNTQIIGVEGHQRLEGLRIRDTARGITERLAGTALFVLIGAGPHTSWLQDSLQLDESGQILTGESVVLGIEGAPFEWLEERPPYPLETSVPGVFAVGDVRHRSPRNVAAAVADGNLAVRSVYEYLHKLG